MATQLTVIRGDTLCTQTINLASTTDDFTDLVYQFVPTIEYAGPLSGSVYFSIPGSDTKNFPPINLYGDVHFNCTGNSTSGVDNQTLFEFRLDVKADVTHL